ncbi:DUF5753 domain-containing protein [Nocardia grenadensis]|uniref:DUF5753 domain-containing protein n=1 Tax=Nocardia grenadensis TaxID=931537 RepID=UPI003D94C41D
MALGVACTGCPLSRTLPQRNRKAVHRQIRGEVLEFLHNHCSIAFSRTRLPHGGFHYRQALTWATNPEWSPEEVARTLDIAQRRQGLLARPNFRFEALLSEAVLRYTVGSPTVMVAQVKHLLGQSEMPSVEVRILPNTETSAVGLMSRSFVLFSFPPLPSSKLQEPPVAFMEGLTGDLYIERDLEVARFSREAERIRHVALSPSASQDLMLRITKERE